MENQWLENEVVLASVTDDFPVTAGAGCQRYPGLVCAVHFPVADGARYVVVPENVVRAVPIEVARVGNAPVAAGAG